MFLDLNSPGNLLGSLYWEIRSPWLGGSSMLNTGPAPLNAADVFSLSQILQDSLPRKYYLSRTACLGILRRARERGKELPPQFKAALMAQAELSPLVTLRPDPIAFAANQRDKVQELHGLAGVPASQPRAKQQTFIASFSAGAGASAGSIGYSKTIAPTLRGTASGNCMPSILCLNDQGGERMDVTLDQTTTLRAQAGGHQPLVFENHGLSDESHNP